MSVVTRFAPSPTGFLHIGGARTALFNWLYTRHCEGVFRLRIEDTDRKRSTEAAKAAILDGLSWLGLDWDGDVVYQSTRQESHAAAAQRLLDAGLVYRCYASPEELAEMREAAQAEGRKMLYDGRWRDRDPGEAPAGVDPVIRFKAPREGVTTIEDAVQGEVSVANEQLDDMVLLRADGTPTYMLSVVVDDHDMEITQVIRGDDHLTNAFRQTQLYRALGWQTPRFAHIPLIHGSDGAKLSKRHGALGVDAYRDMGYLPEALCNYLLRLGWAHGDDEIISRDQAIAWFDLSGIGKSAARFDVAKLDSLNGSYIREADDSRLVGLLMRSLTQEIGRPLCEKEEQRLNVAMPLLKQRVKTLVELAENSLFLVAERPIPVDDKAARLLTEDARTMLSDVRQRLIAVEPWAEEMLEADIREFAAQQDLGLSKIAQPLRVALTGRTASPGIFEIMVILGRDECAGRLADVTSD